MNWLITALLAIVLVLAPIYAATPDEPTFSSFLAAATMLALTFAMAADWRGASSPARPLERPIAAFGILLGLALLSLLLRLVQQHSLAFLGQMARGWTLLATDFALFFLAARVGRDRAMRYTLLTAASLSAAYLADRGVNEYIPYLRIGFIYYRIFVTSTPDFLAGYFVQILPLTLALFLSVLSAKLSALLRGAFGFLLAFVLLFELIATLTTGSRFALASLTVALIVFALSLWRSVQSGLRLSRATQILLLGTGICTALVGLIFAKPVIMRLFFLHDSSLAFRLWTWRGAVHMAASHPLLGTGIGTWIDLYPQFALTGFTRLAHNAYLQLADECGIPALIALLAALALIAHSVWRRLASSVSENSFILCGLLAGLAAVVVQNLIDSDWYVFFIGTTFWTLAGVSSGLSGDSSPAASANRQLTKYLKAAIGAVSALLFWVMLTQGIAATYASAKNYTAAQTWDPLNARYNSEQGFKQDYRQGNFSAAEQKLRRAVAMEPNSVNYRRLGTILQAEGQREEAIAAYQDGLLVEPNSLDLLLALARILPAPQSLGYYQKISNLELTPVGTVRALGDVVETKFAEADAALAENAATPTEAIPYYIRAQAVLEEFADAGGTTGIAQEALIGGHTDPRWDDQMRSLYGRVMAARIRLAPSDKKAELIARRAIYTAKFDKVYRDSLKAGNI